ncbi:MAG TPA: ABC-2 family transporter protein [Anaerolineae bacterium]|nr:ABC-2 family transporter protein [Anaerolineae bacterium]
MKAESSATPRSLIHPVWSGVAFNWRLYRKLIGAQVRAQMQYRTSFILEAMAQFAGNVLDFVVVLIFFARMPTLNGWTLPEIGLLYGLSSVAFGVADMVIAGFDYAYFGPNMVRLGEFDRVLIRPVNLSVQILSSQFALKRLGRIGQGAIVLGWALLALDRTWTPLQISYMIVTIVSGVFFFGGLFIFGSGISFWTVDSLEVMNMATYGGQFLTQFPLTIYGEFLRSFFTFVIPMAFINYFPTVWLLNKPDRTSGPIGLLAFVAPFICVLMFALGVAMWRRGVKHYASTGS